ncbi:MAG: anaerobic sulfatase maturase [Betaproteobacteria bacterium]|nr:MAG: anaerobic sulfatase maturase [Betaproteobacteria bacterium]
MHAFSVMAKPASAACNLSCRYCYYLNRSDKQPSRRMERAVLEAYVRDTIAAQPGVPEVVFGWQGGEPMLAGLAFFKEAVALQERYRPSATRIVNALQTNGTLLDEEWAGFFREHNFLVGLSIDGPARFHDPLRRDLRGRESHARTLKALELLQRTGVEFNTLTVVHRLNCEHGREVYRYLRRLGSRHMQFIPLIERLTPAGAFAGPPDGEEPAEIAPWTAPPEGFGKFLCEVFDDWRPRDVGRVFVQIFEEYASVLAGYPARLCVFASDCRGTPILEANGDLYSCDHYAYAAYRLGNILETPIGELARSKRQVEFGRAKTDSLPEPCTRCEFLGACFGGCPKHRFSGASYLCPSYRRFFAHAAPELARIVRGATLGPIPSGRAQ